MQQDLIRAIAAITLTLAAYTVGVRTLKKDKNLKPLHPILLWLAFCGNAAGAGLLKLALGDRTGIAESLRSACIIISMVILFIHAVWATALMVIPDEKNRRIFMRDSKLVWKIWLIPFVLGTGLGILG